MDFDECPMKTATLSAISHIEDFSVFWYFPQSANDNSDKKNQGKLVERI